MPGWVSCWPDSAEHFSCFPPVFVVPLFFPSALKQTVSFGCETALGPRDRSAGAIAAGTSPSSPHIALAEERWELTASVTKLQYTTKALISSLRDL